MIVADTSAILAAQFAEPERALFTKAIIASDSVLVSSMSVLEARMVPPG